MTNNFGGPTSLAGAPSSQSDNLLGTPQTLALLKSTVNEPGRTIGGFSRGGVNKLRTGRAKGILAATASHPLWKAIGIEP
jgi:hypothetical protein